MGDDVMLAAVPFGCGPDCPHCTAADAAMRQRPTTGRPEPRPVYVGPDPLVAVLRRYEREVTR